MTPPAIRSDPTEKLKRLFLDHRFLSPIGRGAYGEIWLAQTDAGDYRAIKLVARGAAPDSARHDRERRGIQLLQTMTALPDSIVPIFDVREDPEAGFGYVMALADAERPCWQDHPGEYRPRTLRGECVARRALPLAECVEIGIRLAGALDFLQQHRLVHRDIKPSNVIYLHGQPALADVGLLVDTREADSLVGTPGYVPREQHGHFSGDIYSLGILLTEISTGRPADEAGFAPVEESDTDAPGFGRWMDILRRACEIQPEQRHQTAAALLRDLNDLREHPERPAGAPARRPAWPWGATLGTAAAIVALGLAVQYASHTAPDRPAAADPVSSTEKPAPPPPSAPVEDLLHKYDAIPRARGPVWPTAPSVVGPVPSKAEAPAGKPRIRFENANHPDLPARARMAAYDENIFFNPGEGSMDDWRVIFLWISDKAGTPFIEIHRIRPIAPREFPEEEIRFQCPVSSVKPSGFAVGVVGVPEKIRDEYDFWTPEGADLPAGSYGPPLQAFLVTREPAKMEALVAELGEKWRRDPPIPGWSVYNEFLERWISIQYGGNMPP